MEVLSTLKCMRPLKVPASALMPALQVAESAAM